MKTIRRRRKECKTNYLKRRKILKGGKPRIVFRKTNKYIISQYVTSKEAKDKIEIGNTSKELMKYGWPKEAQGSLKSIPSSYLSGYLIAKKILKEKKETPIVDLGMARVLHKTKIFAFIKGLKDAGLEIICDEGAFPEENRIKGEDMKKKVDLEAIKSKIDKI